MAAINQRIPNFLGGVSQQPDTIKFPGQLRVCDNAVPDVTFGLMKRPPGEFVKTLTNANADGYWYDILRDGDEKYLVQMTALSSYSGTKPIRIWNLLTGVEQSLTNSNGDSLFQYMEQTGTTKPYAIQSVQDYTIITNPQKTIGTTGNTDTPLNSGDYAFARLDTIAYNTEYVLYTGSAPSANTYYRVTSLKVDYTNTQGGSAVGSTWDDANEDGRYAGQLGFSFSGGSAVTIPGGQVATEDVEGTLLINGQSFITSQDPQYQGDNASSPSTSGDGNEFIGYVSDYDTRYTATVTLKNGGIIKGTKAQAEACYIDVVVEGKYYRISVEAVEPVETYQGVSSIAYYKTAQSPDKGRASMATILKGLETAVNSDLANVTAEIYGSGLYLYGSAAPNVNFLGGAVNEAMNVFGNTTQDVARLPSMCKHGYIVQVANSENVDADNYYVKFLADNGSGGSGKWEETVRPHNFSSGSDPMVKGLDPATMPHALVNNRNGTFTFKKLDETTANADNTDNYWKYREVGDDETNPFPSFNGLEIQKIFFHRNRLGFVANEQVVMSRPGDYFNFFVVSAITTSDDNPIDITVSDIKPAFINHVLPVQKGVMMFSDNGQFILFTESDIFSPKTARLKKISSYECDDALQPVDMGTSVMFSSSVSAYTRTYEATVVDDDVPPKIVEQTRVVPEFLPKTVDTTTNTTSLGIVSYGETNTNQLYHYKYFDSGERRDQSAWYSWTLQGTLQYMVYTAGTFYVVTKQDNTYILCRHEYVTDATSARTYVVGGAAADIGSPLKTARWFEACLDNMALPTAITYTAQGGSVTGPDFTDLTIPYTPTSADNFYAVALGGTDTGGNDVAGTVVKATSVGTNKATFEGVDMTGWTIAVGYRYTTTVELPNYYMAVEAGKYDIDADLRISGMNFEMGVSGPMEFHLSSKYADMNDYVQYESGMKLDDSDFGKPPSQTSKSVRVPVQKKNEKYNLTIKIPDPFSTALISASWDGIYNQRRHARK